MNRLTAVHLENHRDEAEFDALYKAKYTSILDKARRFAAETQAHAARTLVMISCGFDACSHEYPGMQRHGKHVPPSFYARFAQDAAALADEVADGKLISLLEGGYSDRALTSGALAHVGALAGLPWEQRTGASVPWSLDHLASLERMAKKVSVAASQASVTASVSRRREQNHPDWAVRASEHYAAYQRACGVDARPVELPSEPMGSHGGAKGLLRGIGLPDADTPTRSGAGGHSLRDRTVLRSRNATTTYADATPARVRARPTVTRPNEPMPSLPDLPNELKDRGKDPL